jgi:hypothetical protein
VIFLSTRVLVATENDRDKLLRVLYYVNGTQSLGIKLSCNACDDIIKVYAYVDASYGVHGDCRSHTGVYITFGAGPIFVESSKQKLNTKSSTEAELVAVSDASSQIIWTRNFLIAQGYNTPAAEIFQDNMSTIAIIKKGSSTSKRTRHINIRYYFITDRVSNGEIIVTHMPTKNMIADILTKPLQGELFEYLRMLLLNWRI